MTESDENSVLNINIKTNSGNIQKEETLVIKSSEFIQLSPENISLLNLSCPICKSTKLYLQIPEYNFLKLENQITKSIRASELNYYPILFWIYIIHFVLYVVNILI